MCSISDVKETLTTLLGGPTPAGWVLRFPDQGNLIISLRSGFSTHGALWFEEHAGDACRNWWVPLDPPGALARVRTEIRALLAEGGVTMNIVQPRQ